MRPLIILVLWGVSLKAWAVAPGAAAARPTGSDPLRVTKENEEIHLTLETSPASPRTGEPVAFLLRLEAKKELVLSFMSGQRYDFEVTTDTGVPIWRWSDGRSFTQEIGEETLGPGDSLEYRETWTPHLPGAHRVHGVITADHPGLSLQMDFFVQPGPSIVLRAV